MKKRFLNNLVIAALAVAVVFASCKKDKDEDENGKVPDELIPAAIAEAFKAIMPIYSGVKPPDISGEYVSSPNVLAGTNGNRTTDVIGNKFLDMYIAFIKEEDGKLSYREMQTTLEGASDDVTVTVVGENNKFTAYFIATGKASGIEYKTVTLISGTLTTAGISDYHYGYILLEKGDDPEDIIVDVNTFRIFKDEDGLAVRENWTSKSASASYENKKLINDLLLNF